MDFWLHYWRPEDVEKYTRISNFKMDCTGSNQKDFTINTREVMLYGFTQ